MADAIVGRDSEITLLEHALEDVREGRARVVLIEGEAGIGKSALVGHIAERAADRGLTVQVGRSAELGKSRPFGVVVDAFGERRLENVLGPELSEALTRSSDLDSTTGHLLSRVIDVFVDLLETQTSMRPGVLIFEDIHWADHASIVTMAALIKHTTDLPLLLLLTTRPSSREDLRTLSRALAQAGASSTKLAALADDAVQQLVERTLKAPVGSRLQRWLSAAGGNPLYLLELLASLQEEQHLRHHGDLVDIDREMIPPTLGPAILKRISFLSSAALDTLHSAALLGTSFSLRDLAAVTGRAITHLTPGLTEAKEHGFLEPEGDGFRFRHALIRDALYFDIDPPTQRALHRHAASMLEQQGAPLDQIAEHVSLGAQAPDPEAAYWLHRAGRNLSGLSPDITARWLQLALDLLPVGDPQRANIYADLSQALHAQGRYEEALRACCDALAHGPSDDRKLEVHAQLCLIIIYATPTSLELEQQVLLEALQVAGPEPIRIRLLCELALTHKRLGAPELMEKTFEQARALAESQHDLDVLATIEMAQAWARTREWPNVHRLKEQFERARAATRAARDADDSPEAEGSLASRVASTAWLAFVCDDFQRCDEALRQVRRSMTRTFLPMGYFRIEPIVRFASGDWDEAAVGFESLSSALEWRFLDTFSALTSLTLHLHRGDNKATLAAIEAIAAAVPEWPHPRWIASIHRGDAESVREGAHLLRAGYAGAPAARMLFRDVIRLDRGNGPAEWIESLLPRAVPDALPSYEGARLHLNGLLRDDVEMLTRSVELLASSPHVTQLALAREDAGTALARRGAVEEATELLTAALATYRSMGARRDVASVTAVMRGHKIKVPREAQDLGRAAGRMGLSAAQERVALLVAEGLSNREIADRLYLSRYTVETHLKHIFAKCGVESRAALAALVARDAPTLND